MVKYILSVMPSISPSRVCESRRDSKAALSRVLRLDRRVWWNCFALNGLRSCSNVLRST